MTLALVHLGYRLWNTCLFPASVVSSQKPSVLKKSNVFDSYTSSSNLAFRVKDGMDSYCPVKAYGYDKAKQNLIICDSKLADPNQTSETVRDFYLNVRMYELKNNHNLYKAIVPSVVSVAATILCITTGAPIVATIAVPAVMLYISYNVLKISLEIIAWKQTLENMPIKQISDVKSHIKLAQTGSKEMYEDEHRPSKNSVIKNLFLSCIFNSDGKRYLTHFQMDFDSKIKLCDNQLTKRIKLPVPGKNSK
ncbi:MAG: hypothetical protein JHC93_06245 [Parachlamydiales bacterium]|nr:hypothetical protein [Parachlamydiales bacterium]